MKTCHVALGQRAEGGSPKAEVRRRKVWVGRWLRLLIGGWLPLLLCSLNPSPASASLTLTALVNFYGTNGAQPYAGLLLDTNTGILYGTTSAGGAHNQGTVFSLNPTSQAFSLLYSFSGGTNDGARPLGGLMLGSDGNFYGTTSAGGPDDLGTVFVFGASTTNVVKTLAAFNGTNGAQPECILVQMPGDTNLFGTTLMGGELNFGAVFSCPLFSPPTPGLASPDRSLAGVRLVGSFDNTNTGAYPAAGLTVGTTYLDGQSNLFGVTSAGGSVFDSGAVFMVLPNNPDPLQTLFTFSVTNGASPQAPLLLSTNVTTNYVTFFYGTAAGGGANDLEVGGDGTIFGVTAWGAYTNIVSFSLGRTNGSSPSGGLVEGSDGNFYGTTTSGGGANSGVVFSFNPSNSTPIKLLSSFTGANGANPYGGVVQAGDGNFYGTTVAGGKGKKGALFRLSGFVPYIITQPTNQSGQTSNTITLAVAAGGSAPLTYRWMYNSNYLGGGRNFYGINSPILTISNAVPADSGTYTVIIKNANGSISSTNFTLTVVDPYGEGIPKLKITGPAQNTYLSTTAITVTGTTSSTVGVAHVFFKLTNPSSSASSWQLATPVKGWTRWSADINLAPGTNLFQAYAVSTVGHASLTNTAYFVPSPFAQVAGTYNGLFYDTNKVTLTNAGFFSVQVTYLGKFSGSLQMAGAHESFSGPLDATGMGQATVPMGKSQPLSFGLQLDLTQGTDHITGSVSNQAWVAELAGDLAVFNASTNIAPQQGLYTFVIPGAGATPQPAGDGWGTVKVDAAGNIHLSGALADGTTLAQTVPVSPSGQWPLYVSPSGGEGLLLGWLAFPSGSDQGFGGDVTWLKAALSTAKYYPNGVALQTSVLGSPYAAPGRGTNLFNTTNLLVILSGGGLGQSITNLITLDSSNRVVNQSPNKLSLSFSTALGSFSGSVAAPGVSKPISFEGVVLQNQGVGSGFFLSSGQSGRVLIAPPPAVP
ncbi:MAG: choice-of-anchor tandem repeat GloVer-containing protein [Limisphaerales bacterium]